MNVLGALPTLKITKVQTVERKHKNADIVENFSSCKEYYEMTQLRELLDLLPCPLQYAF